MTDSLDKWITINSAASIPLLKPAHNLVTAAIPPAEAPIVMIFLTAFDILIN
jgi:hypothetical protein